MWSWELEDPRTQTRPCGPPAYIVNSSVGAGLHISSHVQCVPLYQLGPFFSAPSLAFLTKSSPFLLSDFLEPPQKKAAPAATNWLQVLPLCCLPMWTVPRVRSPRGPPPWPLQVAALRDLWDQSQMLYFPNLALRWPLPPPCAILCHQALKHLNPGVSNNSRPPASGSARQELSTSPSSGLMPLSLTSKRLPSIPK